MQENNELVGGRLCLDYTNTVAKHDGTSPYDRIATIGQAIAWLARSGALSAGRARTLARRAAAHPGEARAALKQARSLRESLFRIFSALTSGAKPPRWDVARLGAIVRAASARAHLVPKNGGFTWNLPEASRLEDAIVWPIARSAAELLVSGDVDRIAECGGRECAWLFLDTTKNHSRKFCSSQGCGNRTRVRRHYARTRGATAAVRANRK
jgi:predicted RNA-binding Zn ribbon-like protein